MSKEKPPNIASVDFDAVAPLAPADLTSGRVASAGVHFDPKVVMPPGYQHWDAPPPMRRWDNAEVGTDVDLTGKKVGRFTVMGLLNEPGNNAARWVVRCVCGDYEVRKPNALKAALNTGLAATGSNSCIVCQYQERIKERYAKFGSRPLSHFINGGVAAAKKNRAARSPEDIIAGWIPGSDRKRLAQQIFKDLQKNGYRIVRGQN